MAVTTLSRAFNEAYGRFPPLVRVRRLASEAWSLRPRGVDVASRRSHLTAALATEMTYAMLLNWEPGIAEQLVDRVLGEAEPAVSRAARLAAQKLAAQKVIAGARKPTVVPDKRQRDEIIRDQRRETIVKTAAKLSKLDTFLVNARPIGDCTPEEAEGWAGSRERDARFVRLLISGLPPDRPIRESIKADEADSIYEKAET